MDSYEEMKSATEYMKAPASLAKILDEDGFVFLRGVIDPAQIAKVKREMAEFLSRNGLVRMEGEDPLWTEKHVNEKFDDTELYLLPSFVELLEGDALRNAASTLFQEPAFVHRGPTIRYTIPNDAAHQTPAHQDYFFIRGSTNFMTMWIPLMNIERNVGGLAVAKGSHKRGLMDHENLPDVFSTVFRDRNQRGIPRDRIPKPWCAVDYAPGDLLVFHSHTIHWALPNTSTKVRLSLDARCQPESLPKIWQVAHTIPEQRAYRRDVMRAALDEGLSDLVSERVLLEMMKRGAIVDRGLVKSLAAELQNVN